MIKKFYTICFILLSLQVFSQNVETMKSTARFSTDAELTSYINKSINTFQKIEIDGILGSEILVALKAQINYKNNFILFN